MAADLPQQRARAIAGGRALRSREQATQHADDIFISRYYNWKPGPVTNGYIHSGAYMLKPEAAPDTVATFSQRLMVPWLEKLLADGSVSAYQVATQAIHTQAPGVFYIFYGTATAEGLDKVNAALTILQSDSIASSAFGSITEDAGHRDGLSRINATFK